MKPYFLGSVFLLILNHIVIAQDKPVAAKVNKFEKFQGSYRASIDTTSLFRIRVDNDHLILSLDGQGQTDLDRVGNNKFVPKHVKPVATIAFVEDSLGQVHKFLWIQPIDLEWTKIRDRSPDSPNAVTATSLEQYTGHFKLKGNASQTLIIRNEHDHLTSQVTGQGKLVLSPIEKDKFGLTSSDMQFVFEFIRGNDNEIQKVRIVRTGGVEFVKLESAAGNSPFGDHVSNRQNGFTTADTLRGMLSLLRSSYDVLFYRLDIEVEPESRSVQGSCMIRFRMVNPADRLQIDLYANMKIEKILYHNRELTFSRQYDAVFVQFPAALGQGVVDEISVYYSGRPQVPNLSIPMHGGFLWLQDKNQKSWIESVCQGSGASLWWPCKDHLSDKPDSMEIRVTVPTGSVELSNGRFTSKTDLSGSRTRYDWYVSYPMNNYNAVVNVGDYAHFSDSYIRSSDTLMLNYYCMPYNLDKAKELFKEVKPMLERYEKYFGKYPFAKDGFTVMESLYPMEHQSAVSIGQIDKDHYDSIEMRRLMWHECAHEWWGNSVTCKDLADFWIHEAFATYSEYLNIEDLYGAQKALEEINKQRSSDKEPVIGVYDVNHIHYDIGDMYSKGSLMLNTLRHVINNDSTWFGILHGLQDRFKYQTVTTEDITEYIIEKSGTDYTYFFDQYLRQAALPELQIKLAKEKGDLVVQYKWNSSVSNFHMPIKISRSKNNFDFIYPNATWQTIRLEHMKQRDFEVATLEFYIKLTVE